jgi:hypothetical protein
MWDATFALDFSSKIALITAPRFFMAEHTSDESSTSYELLIPGLDARLEMALLLLS